MKNYHYKLLTVLFLVIFPITIKAQWVTIPDANFVTYLQTNFASCMNGNQMDTTCSGITTATSVNCVNKNISDLYGIQFFDNLQTLNCSSNNLTTLNELPAGLTTLYCANNDLTSVASFPTNITYIDCTNNLLTSLPVLPPGLTSLTANSNNLTSLPNLPTTLVTLNANYNQLNSLPTLPLSLANLFVTNNQLTFLPAMPSNLTSLSCGSNQLVSLPNLPATLLFLSANGNPLFGLPILPSILATLIVNDCSFPSLPSLPATITKIAFGNPGFVITPTLPANLDNLFIGSSELTNLPAIPATVTHVDIRQNNFATTIPTLPPALGLLSIIDNPLIQTLPLIPNTVTRLYLTNGSFTQVPELPDSIDYFYLDNNPQLLCLPKIKRIVNFFWQNTGLTCLPNYGNVTSSTPSLGSLPICDLFNTNSCEFYNNISGKVYSDNNTNCNDDPLETTISPLKINLYQGGNLVQQTYTNSSGVYDFITPNGTYTYSVDTNNVPFQVLCPPSGEQLSVLTPIDSVDLNMDFGLQCKLQNDLGTHAIVQDSGFFRPVNVTRVNVIAGDLAQVYNLNCATGVSGTVTVYYSGPATYTGNAIGSLIPVATPNTLTYAIADFGSIYIHEAFQFYLTTDTLAQAGDQVCITVSVTLLAGDLVPSNNMITHCFSVINSFDPNIKEVSPVAFIAYTGEWLTYTIHFQNTGNAPAQHIVISDTLDAKLQEATFMYLGSSHDPVVEASSNVLKFSFPNINLPDSTNDEPNSHGYVQYKVKIDQGLSLGQIIENNAAIYFDFNAPVITNTTSTLIVAPTALSEIPDNFFTVFPNPSSEKITIRSSTSGNYNLILTDVAGRIVYKKEFSGNEFNFSVNEFAAGMYFLNLESDGKSEVEKVVVR